MVRQSVRLALLVGAVAAMASAHRVNAQCCDQQPSSGCCTPATRKICVTECVPETYTTKRVTYKTEERIEKYTAYKCVPTQEVREKVCTVYKQVPEWREECRKVCVKVPVCEERTVMKPHYTTVTETKCVTKCVDRGHWECREVYSPFKAMCNGMSGLCKKHDACCDPCATTCCTPCAPSNCVTKKVWVSCKVEETVPVTCCKKVCEMRPECIKVHTCRTEIREEKVKVCSYRCVAEQVCTKYTVCVNVKVAYEATRCVKVCVPCEETVTCTRMVARTVVREVPCATESCGTTSCCTTCETSHHGKCWGAWFRSFGHGCGSSCTSGCTSGCGAAPKCGCN